jgi:antitoxin (DNA-binding transcriptional repressor) of toxin-antitoxin stability system
VVETTTEGTVQSPERVGVREFRANLTEYLHAVRLGRSFLLTSRDVVVAEIRPPPKTERPPRRPGRLQGRIRMEPDFDTMPADVLAAMEGEED